MRPILYYLLRLLARLILHRHKPDIIAITGSVGKSSTKEAIFSVLKVKFRVRRSDKNYNNEIGLPLAVIGSKSAGKSIFGWLLVFIKGIILIIFGWRRYPKILILELGTDKPGDIDYLLGIIPEKFLKVGIVTAIGSSHLLSFKSVDNVLKEKKKLLLAVRKDGWSLINQDDEYLAGLKEKISSKILTYGLDEKSDIWAREIRYSAEGGINFKLMHKGSFVPVHLTDALAEHQIYAAIAGASLGIIYGLHLVDISEALADYQTLPGRMKRLSGIKNTIIIDDTYNSSPKACARAIETIARLEASNRKIAVLGDMLELGNYTEDAHREIGRLVAKAGIDKLLTVGEASKDLADSAARAGMSKEAIFKFSKSEEAGKFLQELMEAGDLVLVKGSQGMRMEKVVKEVMAEPLRAGELLVRQNGGWLDGRA